MTKQVELIFDSSDPVALGVVNMIQQGRHSDLKATLAKQPRLAGALIHDRQQEAMRSLLHIATDWPGHFPDVKLTIQVIIAAGCPPDVRLRGPNNETALHWAASSNDTAAIQALVAGGADLELDGSVTDGGTPLANAVNFGQWNAADLLISCGAVPNLYQAAALGLIEKLKLLVTTSTSRPALDYAFWMACSRGQERCSELLLEHGADINWMPEWEPSTALDIAIKNGHVELAGSLRVQGARKAADSS